MHEKETKGNTQARFAWDRFRTILWWMGGGSAIVTAITVYLMYLSIGELNIHVAIATAAGTFFTLMMAAVLMGLMFASSNTGHDEEVVDPIEADAERD